MIMTTVMMLKVTVGRKRRIVSSLVSWCFKPSQPQRIKSGLKETSIKRYVDERTKNAEIDRKNRVRKGTVVGRIYGMKHS